MANPVKRCPKCQRMVTAEYIPGGTSPKYVPVWRFRCECGHKWNEVVTVATDTKRKARKAAKKR